MGGAGGTASGEELIVACAYCAMPLRIDFAQLPRIEFKPHDGAGVRSDRNAVQSLKTAERVTLTRRRNEIELRDFIAGDRRCS